MDLQQIPIVQRTDRQLACDTQAGSPDSFDELVRRHGGSLLRFISVRVRDRHEAEDLLQDTFVRAYERIGLYDPQWSFSTWLYTIASRMAIGHYRKNRPAFVGEVPEYCEGGEDPSDVASVREEGESLWSLAREVLPEEHYAALHLRYGEGMNIKTIAQILGKTRSYIKVILFRSRERLRSEMKRAGTHRSARSDSEVAITEGERQCSASIINT
jgi:RNA polymerase sigma-70 factor (ECF subfamily)